MAGIVRAQPRFLTYRVQNIPFGISKEGLKDYFYVEDRDDIKVKSFCPAVDTPEGEEGDYTATIFFRPHDEPRREPRIAIDVVDIDRSFIGFTPLYVPPREKGPIAVDIIAICGLAGHAFGSWAHSPEHMWIRDYLPRDAPNARILTYGYPSNLQGNTSISTLQDYTTNFVQSLIGMRDSAECESRPIIFIGHSLGCLIIKKALADIALMGVNPSRLPVRTIIFLAAPHRGLNVTAMQTLVKGQASQALIDELAVRSRTLNEINQRFAHIATDIEILTCYETKPTKTAIEVNGTWMREGDPILMVELDSAQLYFPKESLMSAESDHTQIAKIKKGEGGIYSRIKATVRQGLVTTARIVASIESNNSDSHTKAQLFNTQDITPPYSPPHEDKFDLVERPIVVELRSGTSPNLNDLHSEPQFSTTEVAKSCELEVEEKMELGDETKEDRIQRDERSIDLFNCTICKRTISHLEPIYNCVECCTDESGHNYKLQRTLQTGTCEHDSYNLCESCDMANPEGKCATANSSKKHWFLPYAGPATRPKPDRTVLVSDPEIVRVVKTGDVAALQLCKQNKQALNSRSNGGRTPLHLAIQYGLEDVVTSLLEMGVDLELVDDDDLTPLATAILYRYPSIVTTILEHGADVNGIADSKHGPPLHVAAKIGDVEVLRALLRKKPVLDVVYDHRLALNIAMRHDLDVVKLLIDAGADVNSRKTPENPRMPTPLFYAAWRRRKDITKLLIEHGAMIDAEDYGGDTPLGVAIGVASMVACRILLELGADVNHKHLKIKRPPLATATRKGVEDILGLLLKFKPTIEAQDSQGNTALAVAAMTNSTSACRVLIGMGANPEALNCKGSSPLMLAAYEGHLEIVKLLIELKVRVNLRNSDNWSAISLAAYRGRLEMVRFLVEKGAVGSPSPQTKWKYFAFDPEVQRSTSDAILGIVRSVKHK